MGPSGNATISIRCSFFARYAEVVGSDHVTLDVPTGTTVGTAVALLRGVVHNGDQLPDRPMVAVNQEHALAGTTLRDGDEMALLPPLAGG